MLWNIPYVGANLGFLKNAEINTNRVNVPNHKRGLVDLYKYTYLLTRNNLLMMT